MRPPCLLLLAITLLTAAEHGLDFDITDARGHKASGVSIEAAPPGPDGWSSLRISRSKPDAVLIWPSDAMAKQQDGPAPIPAIFITSNDSKALNSPRVVAALATPVLLGAASLDDIAQRTGFTAAALSAAIAKLAAASDSYAKGVGLLYTKKPDEAAAPLATALRERERVLTRIPSEIWPAAMLSGRALFDSGKFNDAAFAFITALKLRPSDDRARKAAVEALTKAGKPEAAEELLKSR